MSKDKYLEFIAKGGIFALYADDEWPADKKSVQAFFASNLPGVVIPTSGSSSARLVCGEQVYDGNHRIGEFLKKVEKH